MQQGRIVRNHSRRTEGLRCTYETPLSREVLGIRGIGLPSGKHLVCGLDTGESMVVENGGDSGVLQPPQAFYLRRCERSAVPRRYTGTYEAPHSTFGIEFSLFYEGFDEPVAELRRISSGWKSGMLPGVSVSQECGQC